MLFSQIYSIFVTILFASNNVIGKPDVRILAPEFVCPKNENSTVKKPDNTIVTIQTPDQDVEIWWTVRWVPVPGPSQRFTLMLWKTVRALEKKLNVPPSEPFVYVIDNEELLRGVSFIFNVTVVDKTGEAGDPKTFLIDNTQGDQKLEMIEGRGHLFSVILVGGLITYPDKEYMLEAQVDTCFPTQDYYFSWSVERSDNVHTVNVSQILGSKLVIPPHSLNPGALYHASCQVIRRSDENFITQARLPFEVQSRGLEIYLSIDHLVVTIDYSFYIECIVMNHDYFGSPIEYVWQCTHNEEACDFVEIINSSSILLFSSGVPNVGIYEVNIVASVFDETAVANATIIAVEPILPILQVEPIPRKINEGSILILVGNASNLAPACTVLWYFATEEYLSEADSAISDTCHDCMHGEPITDTLTIFSLEENFLNEITDYTNETEWRQVTAVIAAAAGRARFVAQCGCSLIFDCKTEGITYADINFQINTKPVTSDVKVSPDTGTALETLFRISILKSSDPDTPLQYNFYCAIGNNGTLLLGSFLEYLAVETFLPYIEGGTEVWVEVCDSLGACTKSETKIISLQMNTGQTVSALLEEAKGHIARCELLLLQRLSVSAVLTYTHGGQSEALVEFTTSLLETLPTVRGLCVLDNNQYSEFLDQLAVAGFDISSIDDQV